MHLLSVHVKLLAHSLLLHASSLISTHRESPRLRHRVVLILVEWGDSGVLLRSHGEDLLGRTCCVILEVLLQGMHRDLRWLWLACLANSLTGTACSRLVPATQVISSTLFSLFIQAESFVSGVLGSSTMLHFEISTVRMEIHWWATRAFATHL